MVDHRFDDEIVPELVLLEAPFSEAGIDTQVAIDLVRNALVGPSDYWADRALDWVGNGVGPRHVAFELASLAGGGKTRPQTLRHRAKRLIPREPAEAPPPPSRAQVAAVFSRVLDGSTSRHEASEWAMRWVAAWEAGVEDDAVWEALRALGAIDLRHGPGDSYLHDDEQIEGWRSDLLRAP